MGTFAFAGNQPVLKAADSSAETLSQKELTCAGELLYVLKNYATVDESLTVAQLATTLKKANETEMEVPENLMYKAEEILESVKSIHPETLPFSIDYSPTQIAKTILLLSQNN